MPRGVRWMTVAETPIVFACGGETLVGVLTVPERPAPVAVLIIVGGPQYRVGSHRQFVLLGRYLARMGYATLRFDYRGMGDSSGAMRSFEQAGADIASAVEELLARLTGVQSVVLWGLCDAASAALIYAPGDPRVAGVVLLNPWVRTDQTLARAQISHYYRRRLSGADLWRKLIRGQVRVAASITELVKVSLAAARKGIAAPDQPAVPFQQRMSDALRAFPGSVLIILSGNDLTAQEFAQATSVEPRWRGLLTLPKVRICKLAESDHTFSRREWREQVEAITYTWLCEFGVRQNHP